MITKGDNHITNPVASVSEFSEICEKRFSRRSFIKTGLAGGVSAAMVNVAGCSIGQDKDSQTLGDSLKNSFSGEPSFDFIEIEHGIDQYHHVAPDHSADILIRWGDPLFEDAPVFDFHNQTVEAQLQQFGYNNDYIGYLPLELEDNPEDNIDERALLCVNHEYPIHGLMIPDLATDSQASITQEQLNISMASVGNSIVEIVKIDNKWSINKRSKYNRRITALETEMELTGPVAGHPRVRTSNDLDGKTVIGTFNNCAGGMTPWGTFLTCEENFNYHFSGELELDHLETENHERYNVPSDFLHWGKFDKRFDVGVEPNEPNRFGWVVEIDPLDPESTPKKRTAMGRFKHEGGENVIAPDGRLVVYMGDDQRFEYLYKFVTDEVVDLETPKNNKDILDHGTLYVAKFYEQGHLEWLPLVHDNVVLNTKFESQAEILLEPRRAADLLGATPMDRPEDVTPNLKTGKVYVMLTNNTRRTETNEANPRTNNAYGHIIEITEIEGDFSGVRSNWDLLVKAGDPDDSGVGAQWHSQTSKNGWFACPDNGVIDPQGRLWVSTDSSTKASTTGTSDGLWAMETEGSLRGMSKMFFRVPSGAEMCGPEFSDDGESLFLAVQHPGDREELNGAARLKDATTLWPDFESGMAPRPSIVVVRKKSGGQVA